MVRVFLDTGVLLYADDADAGPKKEAAREVIRGAFRNRSGVLSTQVLSEYFVNATKKLGLEAVNAQRRVEILRSMEVVRIEVGMVLEAMDLHRLHGYSLWDCLILESAAAGGCSVLYSEDLHDGSTVRGVKIVDPFAGLPDA